MSEAQAKLETSVVPTEGCLGTQRFVIDLQRGRRPPQHLGKRNEEEEELQSVPHGASEFHYGLVHKPFSVKEVMKLREAQGAVDKE